MKCCVCGFNGTEKFCECPKCDYRRKRGVWLDLRNPKDKAIFDSQYLNNTKGDVE